MHKLTLLIFLIYSFSTAQNEFNSQGKRSGIWFGYHDDGGVKYSGEFIDGKETGIFKYYDYNGNLVIQLKYVENGVRSQATLYYSNGALKSKGEYLNKAKHGSWLYYNLEGNIVGKENFSNGLLNGECQFFYESGVLAEKYNYFNNLREGVSEIYYQSGYLNMRGKYHLDELEGDVEFYYDKSNQLESVGKYKMGLKDSIWIFFDEMGDTLDVYDYRRD